MEELKLKILTFSRGGTFEVGVLKDDGLEVVPVNYLGCGSKDMNGFLDVMTPEKQMKLEKNKELMRGFPIREVKVVSPLQVPKQDIICLGINYHEHGVESKNFHKDAFEKDAETPIYFSKRVNKSIGNEEFIDGHWDIVDSLDYEVELGVIIGKDAKNVKKEDALDYIFGYTIINDFSARNLQTSHKQWYFGKSLDDCTAMGPWIVTKNEFDENLELGIRCYVNDELRQDNNTSNMIVSIGDVIAELSAGITLQKGTVISMGTPAGVGMGFDPPKFLKKGDVVRSEIDGIGSIISYIK